MHEAIYSERPDSQAISEVAPMTGIPSARYVHHAGYTVRDLDEAVRFFVDVVGAQLLYAAGPYRKLGTDYMATRLGVHPNAGVRLAVLRLGATLNLELVEFASPDGREGYPRVSDAGGCHLAIHVDDFEAASRFLEAQPGLKVLQPFDNGPPGEGEEGGLKARYVETPFGLHLEIIQRPDRQPYEAHTDARAFRTDAPWPEAARPRSLDVLTPTSLTEDP